MSPTKINDVYSPCLIRLPESLQPLAQSLDALEDEKMEWIDRWHSCCEVDQIYLDICSLLLGLVFLLCLLCPASPLSWAVVWEGIFLCSEPWNYENHRNVMLFMEYSTLW